MKPCPYCPKGDAIWYDPRGIEVKVSNESTMGLHSWYLLVSRQRRVPKLCFGNDLHSWAYALEGIKIGNNKKPVRVLTYAPRTAGFAS